jgi:hypothetical protein
MVDAAPARTRILNQNVDRRPPKLPTPGKIIRREYCTENLAMGGRGEMGIPGVWLKCSWIWKLDNTLGRVFPCKSINPRVLYKIYPLSRVKID